MPLVINSLGGGHTHTHANRRSCTGSISRNQARAGLRAPGLKILIDISVECMECLKNYELKKKGQILCIAGRDHQIATGAKFLDIMHESYGFSAHLIETMNINVPYTKI